METRLPPALAAALEAALEGISRKDLAARAMAQTAAYRAGGTSRAIVGASDALAYAAARLPATFAAASAVFARLAQAAPDFAPASVLDVGAGPGTASWAAAAAWPGIAALTMIDHNPALRALAGRLAANGPLAHAAILAGDAGADLPSADLVVASYVLAEMTQAQAAALAAKLWQRAGTALVLIEPGTPAGFARIHAARAALIGLGAHVAAPCTHDGACPLKRFQENRAAVFHPEPRQNKETEHFRDSVKRGNALMAGDWCHFSQRLARSRDHRHLKGADVPFEDERYSYLAVMRDGLPAGSARILAPPLQTKPGLTFKLCDETGLAARFVPARDRHEIRRVRRKNWGDVF